MISTYDSANVQKLFLNPLRCFKLTYKDYFTGCIISLKKRIFPDCFSIESKIKKQNILITKDLNNTYYPT